MTERKRKVIIGLSPRILRQVPRELGFRNKTLQYLEQSMAHCVMRMGAVAVMIPTVEHSSDISRWEVATEDYVEVLDGLILQGGADIDPTVYGEAPTDVIGPTAEEVCRVRGWPTGNVHPALRRPRGNKDTSGFVSYPNMARAG